MTKVDIEGGETRCIGGPSKLGSRRSAEHMQIEYEGTWIQAHNNYNKLTVEFDHFE